MKNYLLFIFAVTVLSACKKGEEFRGNQFPGFTGAGEDATWVVYSHNITDIPYVTSVLPLQTPPTTYFKLDSTLTASRQKEVSPVSYRIYKNGEMALIVNKVWIKQSNYKWEQVNDQLNVYRNNSGTWTSVFIGFQDEEKLLIKYKKAFFGDTSSDKERFVMEVFYTMFK